MKKFNKWLSIIWCIYNGISFMIGFWVFPEVISTGKSTINIAILIAVVVIGIPLGIKWFYDWKKVQKKLVRLKELENKFGQISGG